MTALVAACLAAGALVFQPQELPGLSAGPVMPLTVQTSLNCRPADVDGDGLADLVFERALWLQEAGRFPAGRRSPLPAAALGARIDVDHGRLYCIKGGRLTVLAWKEGALAPELEQKLHWPAVGEFDGGGLDRFLHDVNGDQVPELVSVSEDGITVFALEAGCYAKAAQLGGLLPEMHYLQAPQQPIWPKTRRALSFPARMMACDLFLEDASLSVIFQEPAPGARHVFERETHVLWTREEGYRSGDPAVAHSAPVPEHVRPCRLNGDGVLDIAGCSRVESTGRAVPISMVETWASLDGGNSFEVRRAPALDRFLPQVPFADMDGDGLADMITESTGLFEGGAREMVERFVTRSSLSHTIRVYAQQAGGFTREPVAELRVEIELGAPAWRNPPMYARYQAGELVNVSGDFDGDGRRDIAVRDRTDRVSVWLARGGAFPDGPDGAVAIDPANGYAVADINGDGRADIIEVPFPPEPARYGLPAARATTVHFSAGGGAP